MKESEKLIKTNEEAIDCLKKNKPTSGFYMLQESVDMAIQALEKQIPQNPKEYEDKYYACPACGNIVLHKWEKYPYKLMVKSNGLPYCLGCGQRLDWRDENDD